MRHFMNRSILLLIGIICIASVAFCSLTQAETLLQSSLFSRIYLAFSVDEKAAQVWLPTPWKIISVPKGPFKGANVMVFFDDNFIIQDGEGKQFLGGSFCFVALASFAKHEQTGEFATFVNRIYWPYDDPSTYKNAVKATVFRGATLQGANLGGQASEVWKVQDSAGGTLEFLMDYQRAVPKRTKREIKARSSADPNIVFIYRDDYADDLVKSVPAGIDRVQKYKFRVTMSELGKMFDGSEQLVAMSVNPSRMRQKFGP